MSVGVRCYGCGDGIIGLSVGISGLGVWGSCRPRCLGCVVPLLLGCGFRIPGLGFGV